MFLYAPRKMVELDRNPSPPPPIRAAVIVDFTNLDRRLHDHFGRNDLDYALFLSRLAEGSTLLETHFFYSPFVQQEDRTLYSAQRANLDALRLIAGVELHAGEHRKRQRWCPRCNKEFTYWTEKGTDAGIAAHLVEIACQRRVDRIWVVSADNDFAPAIRLARKYTDDVRVALLIGPDELEWKVLQYASQLRAAAHSFRKVTQDFLFSCWRPNKAPKPPTKGG